MQSQSQQSKTAIAQLKRKSKKCQRNLAAPRNGNKKTYQKTLTALRNANQALMKEISQLSEAGVLALDLSKSQTVEQSSVPAGIELVVGCVIRSTQHKLYGVQRNPGPHQKAEPQKI